MPWCLRIRFKYVVGWLAAIDLFISSMCLFGCGYFGRFIFERAKNPGTHRDPTDFAELATFACYSFMGLLFSILLLLGAIRSDVSYCRAWLVFQCAITPLLLLFFYVLYLNSWISYSVLLHLLILGSLYQFFKTCIVQAFISDEGYKLTNAQQNQTSTEAITIITEPVRVTSETFEESSEPNARTAESRQGSDETDQLTDEKIQEIPCEPNAPTSVQTGGNTAQSETSHKTSPLISDQNQRDNLI